MDTHKRRIIYMTDKEWKAVKDYAAANGLTSSAFLRHSVEALVAPRFHEVIAEPVIENGRIVDFTGPDIIQQAVDKVDGTHRPVVVMDRKMAQAERDAILRKVNRTARG